MTGELTNGGWKGTGAFAITDTDQVCVSMAADNGRYRCLTVLRVDGTVYKFNASGKRTFELLSFQPGIKAQARVRVACSKGTYIRSLAEDLGRDLGVGGHVVTLHRTKAGNFTQENAVSLEQLEQERGEQKAECLDHHLLAVDTPVASLPSLVLDDDSGFYFNRGQAVMDNQVYRIGDEGDKVRIFLENGQFLGVGQITDDGRVTPKRLLSSPQPN